MYDRLWLPYNGVKDTVPLSTSLTIDNGPVNSNYFRPPAKVLSTAIAADKDTKAISFSWEPANSTDEHYIYLHFAEIEADHVNRQFDIYLDGNLFEAAFAPYYLSSTTFYSTSPLTPRARHQITFNKTGNSIRQPTINAMEIYKVVKQITTSQTNDLDGKFLCAHQNTSLFLLVKLGQTCYIIFDYTQSLDGLKWLYWSLFPDH